VAIPCIALNIALEFDMFLLKKNRNLLELLYHLKVVLIKSGRNSLRQNVQFQGEKCR